jgi:hypothetical protein
MIFFGAEPAAIGDDGVDLAVVSGVAERLRKIPGRLGVGRITLVKNNECRLKREIVEIEVELRKLPGCEQALVNDGTRGERTDVTALGQERFGFFAEK